MTPQQTLTHYFGYDDFRPGQLDIVQAILAHHDTLALLPTGGGKSVCFQVPGLILPGVCVVISPLISLMKDQVDTLNRKGIAATYLNSSLAPAEIKLRVSNFKNNHYKFVYVAPERLVSTNFISICQQVPIGLIAIDEAHCISQWGHDFRPEYCQISYFVSALPSRPVLAAFTATATQMVKTDIISSLQLIEPVVFANSFKRTNLYFEVIPCVTDFLQTYYLLYLIKKYATQSIIIYASTRQATQDLANLINTYQNQLHLPPAMAYHGGLPSQQRTQIQEAFIANDLKLIVATNAFGMGVDKPNVRCVIHYQMPSNIENYYQEAGRAGRDGQPATCYLLFNPQNIAINQDFIIQRHDQDPTTTASNSLSDSSTTQIELNLERLNTMVRYAETPRCRTHFVLKYFDETPSSATCGNCDNCLHQHLQPEPNDQATFSTLLELRQSLSLQNHLPAAQIMTIKIMHWLVLTLPQTEEEVLIIPGIGRGWVTDWWPQIQEVIRYPPP